MACIWHIRVLNFVQDGSLSKSWILAIRIYTYIYIECMPSKQIMERHRKAKGSFPLMLQGERNREKLYAENFTCQHITTTVYSICKVESRLLNFLHVHSSKTGPSKYLENYAHWSTLEIRKKMWNSDALIFFFVFFW